MIIMSRNVHLVDDSVSREVIFVEGAVKTDSSDVARADKGADAGALLENNIMVTNINLRRMIIAGIVRGYPNYPLKS